MLRKLYVCVVIFVLFHLIVGSGYETLTPKTRTYFVGTGE
jgi:hypothetical protein